MMVAKEFIEFGPGQNSRERYLESAEAQTIAAFLAQEFNKCTPGKKVKFLKCKIIYWKKDGKKHFMHLEPFYRGAKFRRFNSNAGVVQEFHSTLEAFSHFTYQITKGYLTVTDLQVCYGYFCKTLTFLRELNLKMCSCSQILLFTARTPRGLVTPTLEKEAVWNSFSRTTPAIHSASSLVLLALKDIERITLVFPRLRSPLRKLSFDAISRNAVEVFLLSSSFPFFSGQILDQILDQIDRFFFHFRISARR